MKRRPPQRHTAQRQETRSVASMKQASEVRDPQRSIPTAGLAAILQRCGFLEFVAHTLSQPRCKPPPAALKRRTWPMGAFKGQKLTAASACGPTEHQLRARRTLSPTPLTSCQPPPPSFAEMNTPSSPSTAPAAPSYFDQASLTSSSPALPQLLPLHPKLRQGNQKSIAGLRSPDRGTTRLTSHPKPQHPKETPRRLRASPVKPGSRCTTPPGAQRAPHCPDTQSFRRPLHQVFLQHPKEPER